MIPSADVRRSAAVVSLFVVALTACGSAEGSSTSSLVDESAGDVRPAVVALTQSARELAAAS